MAITMQALVRCMCGIPFMLLASCGGDKSTTTTPAIVVYLTPSKAALPVGTTEHLVAYSSDEAGNLTLLNAAGVTWLSQSTSIASVSTGGDVSLLSEGTAIIVAAVGASKAQSTLVAGKSTPLAVSLDIVQGIVLNGTAQWRAYVSFADGSSSDVTNSGLWMSTDKTVVSIGPVSGSAKLLQSSGSVFIYFRYGDLLSEKAVVLK